MTPYYESRKTNGKLTTESESVDSEAEGVNDDPPFDEALKDLRATNRGTLLGEDLKEKSKKQRLTTMAKLKAVKAFESNKQAKPTSKSPRATSSRDLFPKAEFKKSGTFF